MKKFIKIILIFLIPIIGVIITVEALVRNIPNRYKFQANYLDKNANKIETLIIGSSHTLYGINPEFVDNSCFNASNVSQTLDIDFEILKHYENDFLKLKTVVLRLSYTTLFEQLGKSNEDWRLKDYKIYFGLNADYKLIHQSELLSVKLKTNIKRIYEYYILNKPELNSNALGWGTNANSNDSNDLQKTGINIAKKHTIEDFDLYKENANILNQIINFCNKRNIQVLLITLPAYKSYIYSLNSNQLNKTISFGQKASNDYDNCRYYNFLNSELFAAEDFFDADHLNEKGARKFSLMINDLITH